MKSKLLKVIKKYWPCFLADTLLLLSIPIIQNFFGDVVVLRTEMFQWEVLDFYLLYGMPLFGALHGILTRVFLKKIWTPNIILFMMVWLLLFVMSGFRFDLLFTVYGLVWPMTMFAFSMVFSLLTSGVINIAKFSRELNESTPS